MFTKLQHVKKSLLLHVFNIDVQNKRIKYKGQKKGSQILKALSNH